MENRENNLMVELTTSCRVNMNILKSMRQKTIFNISLSLTQNSRLPRRRLNFRLNRKYRRYGKILEMSSDEVRVSAKRTYIYGKPEHRI